MVGEKILVVDDKPASVELLAEYLLRPNEYVPLVASDGVQGLQVAIAEQPDLIIVDHRMPKMSGVEMLRELRKRSLDVPVILMTAFGAESVIIEALRLGACDYIAKPFELDEMLSAIERGLEDSSVHRKRNRAWEEFQDRIKRLGSLHGMSAEKVLSLVVDSAVQVTGAEEAYLLLVDESTNELYLRAEKNLGDDVVQGLRMRVQDSIAGHVVRTGQPVLFNPLDANQRFRVKTGYFVNSMINVPLKVDGHVIGVLGVANRLSKEAFARIDVKIVSSLADYASVGIENARLFGQVRLALDRRMKELSAVQILNHEFLRSPGVDRVSHLALLQVVEATGAQAGAIGLNQDDKLTWVVCGYLKAHESTLAWDQGVIGRVVETGKPALIDNVVDDPDWRGAPAETRSVLVVPVLRGGVVMGVICLHSAQHCAFVPGQLQFVVGVAEYILVVLENARLWNTIAKEQRKIEMILSSMADGVYTVDRDLRIQSWNRAAERITGWSQEQVTGKTCAEVLRTVDASGASCCERTCLLRGVMIGGSRPVADRTDFTIIHKNGHPVAISCSVAPLLDHAGDVVGGVSVFRDISSMRMLERTKREFISMVSHQLRSPLTSIMASAELLAEPDLSPDLQTEMVQLVQSQCEVLSGFVSDIISVAEVESGTGSLKKQPVPLEMVIFQVIGSFQTSYPDRAFVTRIPQGLGPVSGDAKKLATVLENLVDNAIKYSSEASPITIQVRDTPEQAVVQVIDQGIGIPVEQLDNLFTQFHRGDGSNTQRVYGTGLGLYVAKKFIDMQGGRIWVQSQVGQGSCFSFALPWWTQDLASAANAEIVKK